MSSGSTLIDVPWPRRLNSEVPPSLLGPDETPVLKNVMTRALPFAVRPRNGVSLIAQWGNADDTENDTQFYNAAATWRPYAWEITPKGGRISIGLVNQQGDKVPDWPYFYDYKTVKELNSAYDSAGGVPYGFLTQVPGVNGGGNGWPPPFNAGRVQFDLPSGTPYDLLIDWDDAYGGYWSYFSNAIYYDELGISSGAALPLYSVSSSKYYDSTANNRRATVEGASYWASLFTDEDFIYFTTATATVSNGSAAVTLSAAPSAPTNLTGSIMSLTGTVGAAGMPNPAYQFQYRVKAHTTGSTSVTLDRPYGLGENTTNVPNLAACSVRFDEESAVMNAIPGGVCYTVFRDRVFQGRGMVSATLTAGGPQAIPSPVGEYGGMYDNAIFWSKPGNWNRWPDQNFAIVDQDTNDPITALGVLDDQLVVFKEDKMFVMTGYDEDSFQIRKASDVVGCPHPAGMTYYEGTLYFADQNGIWAYDGQTVRSISEPQPGRGIAKKWNERSFSRASGLDVKYFWPSMAVTPDGHLVVVCQNPLSTTYADNFVYDIRTDSWSEWGLSDTSRNPVFVVASKGSVYAIHRWFISEITDCWNPAVTTPVYDTYPLLSAAATATATPVIPEIEVWVNATPGQTFRVREMQVDHKVHYAYTDSTPSYTPWTIKMATDPDLTLGSTEHSINARWINSSGYSAADPRHYSDRLPETYQREAQTLRVKFTGDTYPDANLRMKDWSLFRLRFLVDATRKMGVDNSTT